MDFQKFHFVLIIVLLAFNFVCAFRLIHTSQQSQELKSKSEVKENTKNLNIIKKEVLSLKEKNKNETITLAHKNRIDEGGDKPKTRVISAKKVQKPDEITEEITKSVKIEEEKLNIQKEKPIKIEPTKIVDKLQEKLKDDKKSDAIKIKLETKIKTKVESADKKIKQTKTLEKNVEKTESKPKQMIFNLNSSISNLYFNLPSFAPNFEIIENEVCKKQGLLLIEQLNNYKLWALKMLDATAKIPSGILRGNINQFGDFDECLGIFAKVPDKIKNETVKISGKYCLAHIDTEAKIQEMKLPNNLMQARTFIRSKIRDPGHFMPQFSTIRWGICIPSGCSAKDAEIILNDAIKNYSESSKIGISFEVEVQDEHCHVRKSNKNLVDYHIMTLVTLSLITTIILLVLIATIRDVTIVKESDNEDNTLEKILMSFSLKRTTSSMLKQSVDPDEIECLHGFRTICTLFVYLIHKVIALGFMPFTNRTTLTEIANHPLGIGFRLGFLPTDSFLLFSGILTAYGMSKDIEEKGHIPWFNRLVTRFTRLTPSLLIIVLYYAYIMDFLGDGPLWSTVITSNSNLCKEYWWRNILYIQNLYPFEDLCAFHTHQLALDMQLFIIAPILVWFLYRRPLMGVCITILLHAISVILRYYTTLNYRLSLIIYHGISSSQLLRTANVLYTSALHRATPYLAGIGLGVLFRQIKPNFYMPKILSIFGWLMASYFTIWTFYSPSHLSSRMYQYNVYEVAQFTALCTLAWTLAQSWFIFVCFADREGILNTILSSYPMVIFSKISYTFYLVQFAVFFHNVGTMRSSTELVLTRSFDMFEFILVLLFSTLITLLVDMPAQKIKHIILKSKVSQEDSSYDYENDDSNDYANKNAENHKPKEE